MAAASSWSMLIITRHKGQRIVIGHDVEVVVTEISRSGVKLGIVAPSTLTIMRGEVREAVERANRQAVLSEIADPHSLSLDDVTEADTEQHAATRTRGLQPAAKP